LPKADGTTPAPTLASASRQCSLAEDAGLPHGPLELLMTSEVRRRGVGASGPPSLITGATLLNLDSEEDGKLTVGLRAAPTSIHVGFHGAARDTGAVTLSVDGRWAGGIPASTSRAAARTRSRCWRARCALAVAPSGSSPGRRKELERRPRDATDLLAAGRAGGLLPQVVETAAATIRDADQRPIPTSRSP
jgi:hypothetical protein